MAFVGMTVCQERGVKTIVLMIGLGQYIPSRNIEYDGVLGCVGSWQWSDAV